VPAARYERELKLSGGPLHNWAKPPSLSSQAHAKLKADLQAEISGAFRAW
jgi:hypothetical protein